MGERIARIKFKRETGYLYYVKSDAEGWLCIYKSLLSRGGRKIKSKEDNKESEVVTNVTNATSIEINKDDSIIN